jgi:glycosyltransferase involved in cell wall biosynthesis
MKKAMLIIPELYSLKDTVRMGLNNSGYELKHIDYRQAVKKNKIHSKIHTVLMYGKDKFPKIQQQANDYYIKEYNINKPDLVFIYNDEAVLPSTIEYFKKKSKIIILLGDNPLTLNPPNIHNVSILFQADCVVCADSVWKGQLERIGLNNIIYDYLTYNSSSFSSSRSLPSNNREKDILFVGRTYQGAWGYKRCLFLDEFTDLNIDIYGSGAHWKKWVETFPKIKERLIYDINKLPFNKMEDLMYSYKVFPVDANPGFIAGMHLRIFECIAAGILPLIEYTKDIDHVFDGIPLPVIHNYNDSNQLAIQYLADNDGRIKILNNAKEYLNENYSPEIVMKRILNYIQ